MTDPSIVALKLKVLRQLRMKTQTELGVLSDTNPALVSYYERGVRTPNWRSLERIVESLGVSLAEFFAWQLEPPKDFYDGRLDLEVHDALRYSRQEEAKH